MNVVNQNVDVEKMCKIFRLIDLLKTSMFFFLIEFLNLDFHHHQFSTFKFSTITLYAL